MNLADEYRERARKALERANGFAAVWWHETRRTVVERDGTDATYVDDPDYALALRVLGLIEQAIEAEKRGASR